MGSAVTQKHSSAITSSRLKGLDAAPPNTLAAPSTLHDSSAGVCLASTAACHNAALLAGVLAGSEVTCVLLLNTCIHPFAVLPRLVGGQT